MKSAEMFKNAIKNEDFLSAREARRENFGDLIRKVYDLGVSQPLAKYTIRQLEEKKLYHTDDVISGGARSL